MSRVIFLMCISLIAMFLVSKFTRSSCTRSACAIHQRQPCYTENHTQVLSTSPWSSSRTAGRNGEGTAQWVIGINETALRRWMVAGPETSLRRWMVAGPETALIRWMVAGPETALRRWMVAGPETPRLLTECEEKHSRKRRNQNATMNKSQVCRRLS